MPPGEQQQRAPVAAHGHAAGAHDLAGVDEGPLLADLHAHAQLGRVHVHLELREAVEQHAAKLRADVGRAHGEALVRPPREHLERGGPALAQRLLHQARRRVRYGGKILFHRERDAQRMDAEHARQALCRRLRALPGHAEDEDAPLFAHHLHRQRGEGARERARQAPFKVRAVEALEMDLRIADEQHRFHVRPPVLSSLVAPQKRGLAGRSPRPRGPFPPAC